MRVSYNWLKTYLPIESNAEELSGILTGLGLEVSAVEEIESIRGGLHGVVAGKVLTCEKHPNADRLSLTTVDIGSGNPLQIVCGAPNVATGQTVWVATVGTSLYPTGATEPLTIRKAKVRGEASEGMICAQDELGLGTDHAGILVLPDSIQVGTLASDYYQVTSDTVFDIELTPNRSDAICHLGVAADIAAWWSINKTPVEVAYPEIQLKVPSHTGTDITVEVRNTEACPRYCGITLRGITIRESPSWLQNRLRAIDVRPINNIVDITNFVLHEMGQPLHAFDADKISGGHVIVQTLPAGTPFVTLDGVERKLSENDLMICDAENKGMCIGGVYGGLGTGITEATTNVFLESAHFHPRWIRRTSMSHDLRTEAARTFEKTTDPNVSRQALLRAVELILELAGGTITSDIVDLYPQVISPAEVVVRWEMIQKLSGVNISQEETRKILAALHMNILNEGMEEITVSVPTNKADVTREADVIEEILRIYGFDNVEIRPRMEIPLNTESGRSPSALRHDLGNFLAAQGFLEMMGISLVESRLFADGPLGIAPDSQVLIENTSNIHLDLMRHSLLVSALDTVRFNQNRMQNDLMLCEFGRAYAKENGELKETEHLTLTLCGNSEGSGWRGKTGATDFYSLKKQVNRLLDHLGIHPDEVVRVESPAWDYALEYRHSGRSLVVFGRVSKAVMDRYDVRGEIYFADCDFLALHALSSDGRLELHEIPRFPSVHRDIAIVLGKSVAYADVEKTILDAGGQLLTNCSLFDIYENADAMGPDRRSLAIALVFQDPTSTLTDEAVNKGLTRIVSALEKQTGAVLR